MFVAVVIVLIPGAPLIPILVLTQALNAILLLPLLIFIHGISRDHELMGEHASGPLGATAALLTIGVLSVCILALLALTVL